MGHGHIPHGWYVTRCFFNGNNFATSVALAQVCALLGAILVLLQKTEIWYHFMLSSCEWTGDVTAWRLATWRSTHSIAGRRQLCRTSDGANGTGRAVLVNVVCRHHGHILANWLDKRPLAWTRAMVHKMISSIQLSSTGFYFWTCKRYVSAIQISSPVILYVPAESFIITHTYTPCNVSV